MPFTSRLMRRWHRFAGVCACLTALSAASAAMACGGEDLLALMPAGERAALERKAEAVINGQGRLWLVEAPSGAKGHLFGTYHDTEAGEYLSPEIDTAFDGSERLIVELSGDELAAMEARLATDPSFTFADDGNGLAARLAAGLDADERRVAEEVLEARGLSLALATRLRPWILFSLLGTPACQLSAMGTGAPVLDRRLIDRADERSVPVIGLESYEAALGAFGALGEDDAMTLARDMLALAPREEDVRRTLLGLYAEGRTGMIRALSEHLAERHATRDREATVASGEAFVKAILSTRNQAWMTHLVPAMNEPGSFVAVGALHLPGEDGLVALLRADGFTVTPVAETPLPR
ncbi:MAG: TraB/GumN family protein [Pseudomonadota bacterium]